MTEVRDILERTEHRPWPLPAKSWAMSMQWRHVLFAHWPIDPQVLQSIVPSSLEIDVFDDGQAYVGIVPFEMHGVKPRWLPGVPGHTHFLEANVRTYVRHRGERPGVYFFSLDAQSKLAVETARHSFYLPYFHAEMRDSHDPATGAITYRTKRSDRRSKTAAELELTYSPVGEIYRTQPGDLDHWLTERYCLYSVHPRLTDQVYVGDVHHEPWPLQRAEATIEMNSMTAPLGFDLPDVGKNPPLLHYGRQINVVAWSLRRA